ncbi:exportin-6 [Plakobranchus ocellatus]|uniref:Exportin-6 n=1 Tax=Plakobranchus ocellatus TaxID=259542 RepID=A0AAV3YVF5_9GAST|nr:exportin-6 [Plakobranchus ocellatus]
MTDISESLKGLEGLLTEFFAPTTGNERKREIEAVLANFTQMSNAWEMCLYFMNNTQNEYVMMFCLNVLETLISHRWVTLAVPHKIQVRTHLNQSLMNHHSSMPNYIRNKVAKLIVDIGRNDWPHFYPEFFSNILQLAQQPETALLGVTLLQTASEELAAPRDDLSMARKDELYRLLLQQVPAVLGVLNNILESMLEKHRHLVAATPPPSPTSGDGTPRPSRQAARQLFSTSPIENAKFVSLLLGSPNRGPQMEALPPLDPASQQLCWSSLTCLAHYLCWVPLSTVVRPHLLSTIFHFAAFGCQARPDAVNQTGSPGSSARAGAFSSSTHKLGVLAMNCINEILSKNCVPQEFEDFLLQMFQQTFNLLNKITKESNTSSSGNRLEELDEIYVDKFTDFLRLFVSVHLRRFESNPQFPVLNFLSLLFKYTFRQPTTEGYYSCLDIWITFLDYLNNKLETRQLTKQDITHRYKDALTSLLSSILEKFQFGFNQAQLEELDDEVLDDDEETEWQHFLRQNLEVVAKVSELMTSDVFQLVWNPFQEHVETYLGIEKFVDGTDSERRLCISAENDCRRLHCVLPTFFGHVMRREKLENLVTTGMLEGKRSRGKQREKLIEGLTDWLKAGKSLEAIEATKDRKKWRTMIANAWNPFQEHVETYLGIEKFVDGTDSERRLCISAENDCRRLHCVLRDLSSLLQALGRLAAHFTGEYFVERFSNALQIVSRLVQVCSYASRMKFFQVTTSAGVLMQDFTEVHAQSLAAIKAYAHWMSQFYAESERSAQHKAEFHSMIVTVMEAVTPLVNKQTPDRIIQSSAHLLLSLMTTVRPAFLLHVQPVVTLYESSSQGACQNLAMEVQLLVYRSLSHYLLLPWPNLSNAQQDWEVRAAHHKSFVSQLTAQYVATAMRPDLATSKPAQEEAKPVVKRTMQVCQDLVESLAGEVVRSKQICCQSLTDLTQCTLNVFQVYIHDVEVVEHIMTYFLAMFQGLRVQMGVTFTEKVIHTFMNVFSGKLLSETIHQETSGAFRVIENFLKILELIVQEPGSQFKAFLPRIISIAMDQIYPIVAPRPSPDMKSAIYHLLHEILTNNWRYFFKGSVLNMMNESGDGLENSEQFTSILQAYGQSFLQPDISIFRQNLESLETLHFKWKLYSKRIFREVMIHQFLKVLLQVLVQKSHDLLQEEIVISVYNMAAVDFDAFFSDFLPGFLSSVEGIDDSQKTILAENFKMNRDLPSFTQSVQRFVNDIRYYSLINNSLPAGSVSLVG